MTSKRSSTERGSCAPSPPVALMAVARPWIWSMPDSPGPPEVIGRKGLFSSEMLHRGSYTGLARAA